jgi:hypothetical protein
MKTSLLEESYELVKALNKNEKRYFKLYAGFQRGDKTYLKLFDVLDAQKSFNEKKITQVFFTKTKSTNFPAVKKYLFDQLIASLKSYGTYKDLDSDHTDLIETYKVLHYKGLHGQSERLMKKIKTITLRDDAFIRHFYVLIMEYLREMFSTDNPNKERVHQVLEEKKHILNIIHNYTFVGDLFSYQRLYLREKLYCRTKKEKEELTKLMQPVLQTTESEMLSRTALALRNLGLCDYYMAIGEPEKAFETSKKYLELGKTGTGDRTDTTAISENAQHLWLCIRSGIYGDFEERINDFKKMLDSIRNQQKYMMGYERWYNYSFIYHIRRGQFEKAAGFLNSEKQTVSKLENQFSMKAKIMLWYFTAYHHYATKDNRSALKMIQKIINNTNDRMEEFSFAKLLLMFIHFDLKNYELLEYQVRSYRRLMQKNERLYKCENTMLLFFTSVNAADTKKQRQEQLIDLKNQITKILKTPYEKGFSFYIDIHAWLESEITGKEFAQVVQRTNLSTGKLG